MTSIENIVNNQREYFYTGETIPVSFRKKNAKKPFCLYQKIQW